MAKKSGGFKAAKNYDPRRGKRAEAKRALTRAQGQASDEGGSTTKKRPQDAVKHTEPRPPRAPKTPSVAAGVTLIEPKITTRADAAGVQFSDLGVGKNLIRVLGELGAAEPYEIQVATIADTIAGHSLLGRAKTGSGKTLAFGVGVIERLLKLKAAGEFGQAQATAQQQLQRGKRQARPAKQTMPARAPKVLILAPTRELALQIDASVQPLARAVGFYTAQLVGGVPIQAQVHALARGVDVVIGTPGRIADLIKRRQLDVRQVRISVIDEADHMSDMGFIEQVREILRGVQKRGQTLLFSATLDEDVRSLVAEFMPVYKSHAVADSDQTAITHAVFVALREEKLQILLDILKRQKQKKRKTLVFVRTKTFAQSLTQYLIAEGLRVVTLHGDLNQQRRSANLAEFATGAAQVLVATDVAARGLHIDFVDLVVQADAPSDAKTYLHRAGRTARAGASGTCVTLALRTGQKHMRELLTEAGVKTAYFDYLALADLKNVMKDLKI